MMKNNHIAIEITIEDETWVDALPEAESVCRGAALAACAAGLRTLPDAAEVSVLLADDATVGDLNRRYRAIDKPTNVLSFPATDMRDGHAEKLLDGQPLLLGDVAVARETVAREAREAGRPLADHLAHMIVHGVLHLLGYDHMKDDEAETMEALERSALARLGVADPYGDRTPGSPADGGKIS